MLSIFKTKQPRYIWFGLTTLFALIMVTLLGLRPNSGTRVREMFIGTGMPSNYEPTDPEEKKKAHDLAYAAWAMGILATMSFVVGFGAMMKSHHSQQK
jgi:hypothetical protein